MKEREKLVKRTVRREILEILGKRVGKRSGWMLAAAPFVYWLVVGEAPLLMQLGALLAIGGIYLVSMRPHF